MVNLKDIQETLKKIESNRNKLIYLKKVLDETDDKNLQKQIKQLIEDIKELDSVAQIETRGKVEWGLAEEESPVIEERNLERQVIGIPMVEKEEGEEKVEYGISHSGVTYMHDRMNGNYLHSKIMDSLRNENLSFDENLPVMEDQKDLIEERVRKYMPTATEERIQEETSSVIRSFRYDSQNQQGKGYASVSQEVHERQRKKPLN